ncbi:hypothetical protein BJX99DRAFT_234242 [Aspergillus californicus]
MQSDPSPPQDDLSSPNARSLPVLAVSLSAKGPITTKDTGQDLVPVWTVKITIAYLNDPNTPAKAVTFQKPRLHDVNHYQLLYLLDDQWRDAELGVGCLLGMDFSRKSEINVAYSGGKFVSLNPGESFETEVEVFQLDWECLNEAGTEYAGDVFSLQHMGGTIGWWAYGGRKEHMNTVLTVDAFSRVLGDSGEKAKLVVQPSNVLQASWCK